jgi:hypothetical protein
LGAIDALLPELSHWSIDHLSANIPPHVNSPGRVIVNLGGLRVTDAIRDRVLRVARDQESEAVRAIRRSLAANTPVWVSVRTRNRTADNQRDFIVAACRRIVSSYPDAAIILDGHSVPMDAAINANYNRRDIDTMITGFVNDDDPAVHSERRKMLANACQVIALQVDQRTPCPAGSISTAKPRTATLMAPTEPSGAHHPAECAF